MAEKWGPWVAHDGRPQPVPDGTYLQVEMADGSVHEGKYFYRPDLPFECDIWDWDRCRQLDRWDWRAVQFRTLRPRALLDLIEMVENLPVPARPQEVVRA